MIESYEQTPELEGFHVTNQIIADFRDNLIGAYWPASEAVHSESIEPDRQQFAQMDKQEQYYIICTLVMFLISDDFVDEVIEDKFLAHIKNRIWRGYETQKKANEDIHSEVYRLLLEYLVPDDVDQYAKDIREKYTFITDKIEWCRKSLGKNTRLAHYVFIMTIIELLFFSTSFASIFWYKTQNKLPGIAYANEIIARDEGTHGTFNIYIYNTLEHRLDADEARRIMIEAVDLECAFAEEITPSKIGINKNLLCKYAQFMADDIMVNMGYKAIYNVVDIPLSYMADFGIRRKTDFFRKKDNQYQQFVIEPFKPINLN